MTREEELLKTLKICLKTLISFENEHQCCRYVLSDVEEIDVEETDLDIWVSDYVQSIIDRSCDV